MGQGEKNVEYEVKLYFAIFLRYVLPPLCLERESREGKWEREYTNMKIRLRVNLWSRKSSGLDERCHSLSRV